MSDGFEYTIEFSAIDGDAIRVFRARLYNEMDKPVIHWSPTNNGTDQMPEILDEYHVISISPLPCSVSHLVATQMSVDRINGLSFSLQNCVFCSCHDVLSFLAASTALGWSAHLHTFAEGITLDTVSSKLGLKDIREARFSMLMARETILFSGQQMPREYDARDRLANETQCRGFEVQDQKECGSCFAFGTICMFCFFLLFLVVMDCKCATHIQTQPQVRVCRRCCV